MVMIPSLVNVSLISKLIPAGIVNVSEAGRVKELSSVHVEPLQDPPIV